MASVPRLVRPQTMLEPVRAQVAPAVDPLAAAAPPVARGIGAVASAYQRELQRVSEIRVNEAESTFAARLDQELLDPKRGLLQQRGARATEGLDGFRDRVQVAMSEVEAGLTTPEQKALFRRAAVQRQAAAYARADAHVGAEERRSDQASHEALFARDMETIAQDAGNDVGVAATLKGLAERIVTYADRNGIPPEAAQQQVRETVSAARLAQVGALAAAENEAALTQASKVLEQHGAQMTVQDREKAKQVIETADIASRSRTEAAKILAAHPNDERAALAAARQLENTRVSDATVQRLEARFADDRRLRQQEQTALLERTSAIIERTGDVTKLTPADWERLATIPGARKAMTDRARQVRDGVEPETDWARWTEISEMSAQEVIALDPATERPHLSDQMYKEFVDRRAALLGTGGRVGRDRQLTATQVDRSLLGMAQEMGLIGRGVTSATQLKGALGARYGHLREAVALEVANAREEKKNPLTPEEVTAAMQRVLDDQVVQAKWLGMSSATYPRAFAPPGVTRPAEPAERIPVPRPRVTPPPLRPGTSRADRWEELRRAGMTPAEATAQVQQEIPR